MVCLPVLLIITFLFCRVQCESDILLDGVVFVIIDSGQPTHDAATSNVIRDLLSAGVTSSCIVQVGKDVALHGAWTYLPLFQRVLDLLTQADTVQKKWFVFLNEAAGIDVKSLSEVLKKYDPDLDQFLGKALRDSESTIIHHFNQNLEFEYPDAEAAIIFSCCLFKRLARRIEEHGLETGGFPGDFAIDPAYELARVILLEHLDGGLKGEVGDSLPHGPRLRNESALCVNKIDGCSTWRRYIMKCDVDIEKAQVLALSTMFAVKTCEKYHSDRLPVILDTWAAAAPHSMFFSEVADSKFGTTQLPGVRENTERGHCAKTEAILKYFHENAMSRSWDWLVIVDDDTVLSVYKMMELLNCYSPSKVIAIGQRYGFRVATGFVGYDYPTGGAGMLFSAEAVKRIVENNCNCQSPDSPDDMHLGACLSNLGQVLIHSSRLHQGRPEDYSPQILLHQDPVSFHKFWNTDPRKTYTTWFSEADEPLRRLKNNLKRPAHEEL